MAGPVKIAFGAVVLIPVNDPVSGASLAPHPAVLLSPKQQIDAGLDVQAAVCSTSFTRPLPSGVFDIPSGAGCDELTGLWEACVVKATWLQIVPQSQVIKRYGTAPSEVVKLLRNWLEDQKRLMLRKLNPPEGGAQ